MEEKSEKGAQDRQPSLPLASASEILWYFNTGLSDFDLPEKIRLDYQKRARMEWLWRILASVFRLGTKKRSFVFLGAKYKSLMSGLPREEVLIVGGFRQLVYSLIHRTGFYPSAISLGVVLKLQERTESNAPGLTDSDPGALPITSTLQGVNARLVIVDNDSCPLERAWIAAARQLSVHSLCIQHGLLSRTKALLIDGKFADAMLVYDDWQQQIVSTGAYHPENVIAFGYHSDVRPPTSPVNEPGQRRVCILGQPWPQYYPDMSEKYQHLIREIMDVLSASEIPYVYKPHPAEVGAEYLNNMDCTVYNGGLVEAIEQFDAFVSLTSTALLEVTLHHRVAIQVFSSAFSDERFDTMGYAHLVERERLNELPARVDDCVLAGVYEKFCGEPVANRFHSALAKLEY